MRPPPLVRALLLLGAAAAVVWSLAPFVWFLLTSLTTPGHIPRRFALPDEITLRTYAAVLMGGDAVRSGARFSIVPNILNSFAVAGVAIVICTTLSVGSAYVFSRGRGRVLRFLFNALLLIRMTPGVSLAVPVFLMMSTYKLIDTHLGLGLVHAMMSLPLAIWLMKGFFDGIPPELEQAAWIDGAGLLGALRHVVLPLAAPGAAVVACFVFLASYNEFMFATILSRGAVDTLPIAIAGYNSEHQTFYNEMAAASFLSMLPMAAFFALAGRWMVGGLTMGALK